MKSKKKTNKPRLHAFIGVDDDNNINLFVSPGPLNVLGKRVEKGTPFPPAVYAWANDGGDVMTALQRLDEYFARISK